jgi:peptidoglycan biosynthesis protein MviN/MurJ (putative lipid II flippase)
VSSVIEVGILCFLWVGFARGRATPERFVRYSAATVCTFVAFDKVLSPQYLIWLVVLVPLVRGSRGALSLALLIAALLCTDFVWYSSHRFDDYAFSRDWAWLVLTRNLLLVVLVVVLAAPSTVVRASSRKPSVESAA